MVCLAPHDYPIQYRLCNGQSCGLPVDRSWCMCVPGAALSEQYTKEMGRLQEALLLDLDQGRDAAAKASG